MDDTSTAKRPRLEDGPESAGAGFGGTQEYEKGSVWLDDGNVVIVAERTAFKVLRSILSRNSDIFRDMFAMPQPANAEVMDGCPVVQLPDSKKDVAHVLSALFDHGNSCVQYLSSSIDY